jgi:hypothetical protein
MTRKPQTQLFKFDQNGYDIHFPNYHPMPRARSKTRRRGHAILKQIVIEGFSPPLIIENGKQIQHWTVGLREQLKWEAFQLRQLTNLQTSRLQAVFPNEISETSISTSEMTENGSQTFEGPQGDHKMVDSDSSFFEFIECDVETSSDFSENATIQ